MTDILGFVPENLELCLLARVPDSDQDCQLAVRLYKQLLPEVNLLECLLSQSTEYNSLPRDIKRQIEVSDCLLALVNVYMNYFMSQLDGELKQRSCSDEISMLEKELLSHQVDDNLRLLVANTRFCHDLQSQSLAKHAVQQFVLKYQENNKRMRDLLSNQIIVTEGDFSTTPPWPPPEPPVPPERRRNRSRLSASLWDLASTTAASVSDIRKVPRDEITVMFSPLVAAHHNELCKQMAELGFDQFLERTSTGNEEDLSIKSEILDNLRVKCSQEAEKLRDCLANIQLLGQELGDKKMWPQNEDWCDNFCRLKILQQKASSILGDASDLLKHALRDKPSFGTTESLDQAMSNLGAVIERC